MAHTVETMRVTSIKCANIETSANIVTPAEHTGIQPFTTLSPLTY